MQSQEHFLSYQMVYIVTVSTYTHNVWSTYFRYRWNVSFRDSMVLQQQSWNLNQTFPSQDYHRGQQCSVSASAAEEPFRLFFFVLRNYMVRGGLGLRRAGDEADIKSSTFWNHNFFSSNLLLGILAFLDTGWQPLYWPRSFLLTCIASWSVTASFGQYGVFIAEMHSLLPSLFAIFIWADFEVKTITACLSGTALMFEIHLKFATSIYKYPAIKLILLAWCLKGTPHPNGKRKYDQGLQIASLTDQHGAIPMSRVLRYWGRNSPILQGTSCQRRKRPAFLNEFCQQSSTVLRNQRAFLLLSCSSCTFCWVPWAWWSACWPWRSLPTTMRSSRGLPAEQPPTPVSASCPPWSRSAGPLCTGMWLTVPASLARSNCSYSSRWFLTWAVALCAGWLVSWCGNTGTRSFTWAFACAP